MRKRKRRASGEIIGEGSPVILPSSENAQSDEEVAAVVFRFDVPPSSCNAIMTVSMMPSKMRRMTGSATSGSTSPASKRTSYRAKRKRKVIA